MTLSQLIRTIEKVAIAQPSINSIVQNDIFKMNSHPSLEYGVFAWTQGQHNGSVDGNQSYSFSLFYVDRLTASKDNEVEVQSVGCETLRNILKTLSEEYDVDVNSYTLQTFNQRFTDECAGVFANVTLTVLPITNCSEEFDD